MKKYIILLLSIYSFSVNAQETFSGTIFSKESNKKTPLEGANVFWLGTQIGAVTDQNGNFSLPFTTETKQLVISYLGFKTDTLTIEMNDALLEHILYEDAS